MTESPFEKPPAGLLGEIAGFIYSAAPRPVPEIATAGAIGYMAGVAGRAFNVSGTGLNQYVLLVAETGRGKEGARSGVMRFIANVQRGPSGQGSLLPHLPTLHEHLGPAEIASGQALIKYLGNSRSFTAFVGEFGHTIERICHPRATSADVMLRKVLLDLFNLSGEHDVLNPTIYSDKANNTGVVDSPAFSLFGETSPQALYPHLSESMVALGLLPRFTPIIYEGPRPPSNPNTQAAVPTVETIRHFSELVAYCAQLNASNAVVNVQISPEAHDFIGPGGCVDKFADDKINDKTKSGITAELWNRAHLKTLKLAALVAVGRNHISPTITLPDAEWAYAVVRHGIEALAHKFDAGEVGDQSKSEKLQQDKVRKVVREWVERPWSELKSYGVADEEVHRSWYIPWRYISKRLSNDAAFKNAHNGATNAIRNAVRELIDCGEIARATPKQLVGITTSHAEFFTLAEESDAFGGDLKRVVGDERRAKNKSMTTWDAGTVATEPEGSPAAPWTPSPPGGDV